MFVISVDTACDMDYLEMQKKGIKSQAIPFFSMYNEHEAIEEYRMQSIEYSRTLACKLIEQKTRISTHGLTPFDYQQLDYICPGSDVLQISLSESLSGTYQNALTYARESNRNMAVINSKTCSAGMNILVDKALEFVDNHNVFEAAEKLEELKNKIATYFITTNTHSLNMSGRLTFELKSSNQLKPCVLGCVDENGKLKVLQVLKSQDIAIFALIKRFSEQVEKQDEHPIYISYALNSLAAKKLEQGISLVAKKHAKTTRLSPICTAVGGTETVVLAFVKQ